MPPCAAIECARRGESWKQKQATSYPSSASVAAAAPPARPEPTTMTLYLRLFAGLTRRISNFALDHFCSIGPDGRRASSFMSSRSGQPDDADEHGRRRHHVADEQERRDQLAELVGGILRMAQAERLQPARGAVTEVEREHDHAGEVDAVEA